MRRAYRLAVEHNIHPDNEIWYGAPTFKQAKRVMWNRLKCNIPEDWISGRPKCVMQMRTCHVLRIVGLDDPDALRGSGLWFFLGATPSPRLTSCGQFRPASCLSFIHHRARQRGCHRWL